MPVNSKCSKCSIDFDCEAYFPMNCKCGKTSICLQCSTGISGFWKTDCCCCAAFEFVKDPIVSKLAEERRMVHATVVDQLLRLKSVEKLNREKDAKIAEFEKNQGKTCDDEEVSCTECQHVDNEKNFSICRTCTKEYAKIDVCDTISKDQLYYTAICNKHCLTDNHQGHEILDFYPILASINHKTQVLTTSMIHSKLDKTSEKIRERMEHLLALVEEAKKATSTMTEYTRDAKSSGVQKKLNTMINDFYVKVRFETDDATKGSKNKVEKLLEVVVKEEPKETATETPKTSNDQILELLKELKESKVFPEVETNTTLAEMITNRDCPPVIEALVAEMIAFGGPYPPLIVDAVAAIIKSREQPPTLERFDNVDSEPISDASDVSVIGSENGSDGSYEEDTSAWFEEDGSREDFGSGSSFENI